MYAILLFAAASFAAGAEVPQGPDWATESVPDTVVALVERAMDVPEGEARKGLLRDAEALAREAVAEHESDVGRRYALAVVLGLRANSEGGQSKVEAASDLSKELAAILALAPEHAGAHHMLGRLHAGIRRMSRVTRWVATSLLGGDQLKGASWEAAEEHLAFAEAQAPEVADHHLQLALLYRDTHRPDLAVEELRHVFAIEATNALEISVRNDATKVWSELGQ